MTLRDSFVVKTVSCDCGLCGSAEETTLKIVQLVPKITIIFIVVLRRN